jgi:hypothetical protein
MRTAGVVAAVLLVLGAGPACEVAEIGYDARGADLLPAEVPADGDVAGEGIPDVPLDAPPDVAADVPAVPTALLGGGTSYGECMVGCVRTLTVEGSAVRLRITDWDQTLRADPAGTLTAIGKAGADGIAAALVGQALEDRYGCPDCADGGASWVTLRRADLETTHTYETGNPPELLVAADAWINGVMAALKACTATADVIPDAGCQPASN